MPVRAAELADTRQRKLRSQLLPYCPLPPNPAGSGGRSLAQRPPFMPQDPSVGPELWLGWSADS